MPTEPPDSTRSLPPKKAPKIWGLAIALGESRMDDALKLARGKGWSWCMAQEIHWHDWFFELNASVEFGKTHAPGSPTGLDVLAALKSNAQFMSALGGRVLALKKLLQPPLAIAWELEHAALAHVAGTRATDQKTTKRALARLARERSEIEGEAMQRSLCFWSDQGGEAMAFALERAFGKNLRSPAAQASSLALWARVPECEFVEIQAARQAMENCEARLALMERHGLASVGQFRPFLAAVAKDQNWLPTSPALAVIHALCARMAANRVAYGDLWPAVEKKCVELAARSTLPALWMEFAGMGRARHERQALAQASARAGSAIAADSTGKGRRL